MVLEKSHNTCDEIMYSMTSSNKKVVKTKTSRIKIQSSKVQSKIEKYATVLIASSQRVSLIALLYIQSILRYK
jgi:hypothetical protein